MAKGYVRYKAKKESCGPMRRGKGAMTASSAVGRGMFPAGASKKKAKKSKAVQRYA